MDNVLIVQADSEDKSRFVQEFAFRNGFKRGLFSTSVRERYLALDFRNMKVYRYFSPIHTPDIIIPDIKYDTKTEQYVLINSEP